jgi:hypothetical protein
MILNLPQYHNGGTADGNKKKNRKEELSHNVLEE